MDPIKYVMLKLESSPQFRGMRGRNIFMNRALSETFYNESRIHIEEGELTKTELASVSMDESILTLARSMPLQLVQPLSGGAQAMASGDSWGIGAIKADQSPFDGSDAVVAVLDTGKKKITLLLQM